MVPIPEIKPESEKEKSYFATIQRKDEVSEKKSLALSNREDRRPGPLMSYYAVRKWRLKNFLKDNYDKIEKIIEDKKIKNLIRVPIDIYDELFNLMDDIGEELSEDGYINLRKIDVEQFYDINYISNWLFHTFGPGKVNVVYGPMGAGKSNVAVLFTESLINSNNFIVCSNFGMFFDRDFYKTVWMLELLKILAINSKRNIEIEEEANKIKKENKHILKYNEKQKKANPENPELKPFLKYPDRNIKYVCVFLDELEKFIVSHRSSARANVEFNIFLQMARKLYCSFTLIGHRKKDIPPTILESASLNAEIIKGEDLDEKPVKKPKQDVYIKYREGWYLHLGNIEYKGDLYDHREFSSFDITQEDHPRKSVDMGRLWAILKEYSFKEIPDIILKFIDSIENPPKPDIPEDMDYTEEIKNISGPYLRPGIITTFKSKGAFQNYIITEYEKNNNCVMPDGMERQYKKVLGKLYERHIIDNDIKDAIKNYDKNDLTLENISKVLKASTVKGIKRNRNKFKWRERLTDSDIAILNIEYGITIQRLSLLLKKGKDPIQKIIDKFNEGYDNIDKTLEYAEEKPYSVKEKKKKNNRPKK